MNIHLFSKLNYENQSEYQQEGTAGYDAGGQGQVLCRARSNSWSPVNVWPKKACDWSNFCHIFLKIYVQFTWLVIMSGH
jgi:hypothetical protein